jgi:hypothetical protein
MRIEILILARLSASKPPKPSDVADSLARLAAPAATKNEWRAQLATLLDELRARSLVERMRLTEAGTVALRNALGVAKLPPWKTIRDRLLPTIALGEKPDSSIGGEQLAMAVLAEQLRLQRQSTWTQLLDALVAAELGLPAGKVTLDRIRAHFLSRRAGITTRGKAEDVAKRIAAMALRAPNAGATQLRPALIQRWLGGASIAKPEAGSPTQQTAPLDARQFTTLVEEAVRAIGPDGRFGPYKVFISAIWRQLAHDRRRDGMTLADLKRRLLDANRAGTLSLARADLVGAMDPKEVATSEITDLGSSFHFVIDRSHLP